MEVVMIRSIKIAFFSIFYLGFGVPVSSTALLLNTVKPFITRTAIVHPLMNHIRSLRGLSSKIIRRTTPLSNGASWRGLPSKRMVHTTQSSKIAKSFALSTMANFSPFMDQIKGSGLSSADKVCRIEQEIEKIEKPGRDQLGIVQEWINRGSNRFEWIGGNIEVKYFSKREL